MHRWNDTLWIFTPEEYDELPAGIELTCINGTKVIKDKDYIDMDVRFGHIAYGVTEPTKHKEAELFLKFMLKGNIK